MILNDLNGFDQIVIQVHDNPDADAAGSGYSLYRYFKSLGKDVRLVYGGRNEVSKSNMKMMLSELEIPLEYIQELDAPELLLTVDCQYGQGNVQRFEARNIAMIDHHNTGKQSDGMSEIRSHLVSCSTICYAMLKDAGFDVNQDIKISTALYYGLYMDSNQLSEISHPLDRDMIDFLRYDKPLLTRLKYANFSISELETAGIAISHNNYIEKYRAAIVRSEPCDPNILGVIGDFVIQVDSIDVCVIYNECPGGYKLSVRSCSLESSANELAGFLTAGAGNGGGHINKAGGFISASALAEISGGRTIEQYLRDKLDEYFEGYDVVRYTSGIPEPEKLHRYRKKPGIYGYVRSTDIAGEGTQFKVRTLEGDVFITSRSDIYIMIGTLGEVYPLESRVFDMKYTPLDEPFTGEFEYAPSVIDTAEGKSCSLMPIARKCRSGSGGYILARPLEKFTKVFTKWDYEAYMSGKAGDMLCCTEGDGSDVYVVKREIFDSVYERIEQESGISEIARLNKMNVISHYDNLIREDNDPFRDPQPLKDYMNKWDGQIFIDSMCLSCDKKVLEIGIGTGRIASKVAPLCMKLCGIDISPETIRRATENLSGYNNIQLICADFLEYNFDQTFDVIYSSLTMMHFEDKQNVIHKVAKLLNRNGIFCLSIDKNTDNQIDMGSYKLKVFPDNVEDIIRYIGFTDMSIASQYETEFAHIFVCTK